MNFKVKGRILFHEKFESFDIRIHRQLNENLNIRKNVRKYIAKNPASNDMHLRILL